MNIEEVRDLCLSLKYASEDMPFDDNILVTRVGGKIFSLLALNSDPASINLKCDPEKALKLREQYPHNVLPGYHMSKKHWNTVKVHHPITKEVFMKMLNHSYDLIYSKLPKRIKEELKNSEE